MGDMLRGRSALVTGAGRGIGREIALALAREGARVVVNDLGGEATGSGFAAAPADTVVAEIKKLGGEAVASYDSVADFQAARRIIQTALDSFGRLDILVNNAGIFRHVLFEDMTEEDWDSVIAVHLKGHFNTCKHAVPVMKKQRYGRIINTTSSQWRNPEGRPSYAAAKGGIVSLTWELAWELRNHGITVNAIAPKANTRGRSTSAYLERLLETGLKTQKVADALDALKEWPEPVFVPPMVVYLASDLAAHVNGCIFQVEASKIALYSHPTETRAIYRNYKKDGPWPIEELTEILPRTILAGETKTPHIP